METSDDKKKCSFGDGITVKPDGKHELDPCVYKDILIARNVTVTVSKCKKCGHIEISWTTQDNSEIEELE